MAELFKVVEEHVDWGLSVLKKFIEVPTVNPPGENYREFVDLASKTLEDMGFEVDVYEVPEYVVAKYYSEYAKHPRYIVIGRLGSGKPVVHFNGHYDVVPPGSGWSKDPFKPVVENGKLYGRGSADMKGGIVASLVAIKAFKEVYREFSGSVEVALVPDEEIGGETGTGYLVREGLSKPDYVVIAEPSGSGNVWIGHRGAFWFYVEIYGKQAHGSAPWLGINAFEYMVKVAQKLMTEYKSLIEKKTSSYIYDDPKGAKPTVTIGGEVKGGAKVNIVPGYFAFSVDRRLIVEEKLEEVEREVTEFISKIREEYPNVKVNVKVVNKLPPAITNPESTLVKAVSESVKEVLGRKPRLTVCLGGLDMRFYSEKGIETITYGPGPLAVAHQANEYLEVSEFVKVAKVYASLLQKLLVKS